MHESSVQPTLSVTPLFTGTFRQSFRLQKTIGQAVRLKGFGFWTGEDVSLEFRPAPTGTGIVFVRADLPGEPRIPAKVEFREEKPRQTSLVKGSARVDMVEHVLAAVKALQIDNCEIRTDRPEMPGFDGSSLPFFLALQPAGSVRQPAVRTVRLVTRAFRVGNDSQWINVMPNRNGVNSLHYTLVAGEGYPIPDQEFRFELSTEAFQREIVSSRTFLSKAEADYLIEKGLCCRVTPRDVIVLTENGPLENEFRFEDECARHKILDMVGDFSLCDCDWIGTFESYRGGHALNAECVKQLLENSLLLDESFIPQDSELMHVKRELLKKAA